MDYIGATPQQNPIMGLLAERLKQAQQFAAKPFGYQNPPAEMLMNLLGIPAVQQTAERLAYGEPLTTGRGMTTRPRPEAVEAALTVAPVAGLLGKATKGLPVGASIKSLDDFAEIASKGKVNIAKSQKQELDDLLSGKSKFAEVNLNWDMPETYDLADNLAEKGFKSKIDDRGVTRFYKNEKDIQAIESAQTPIDFGKAYGYSDEDIAAFYLQRRGGDKETAYQDFLSDKPVGGLLGTAEPKAAQSLLDTSYRGSHTAPGPDFGAPLYDLTGGGQMYPADVYSSKAAQYYGTGYPKADKEAFALANKVRGNPDAEVTMYRAVPKDESISNINAGDWVTLSKEYAKTHGESALRGDYKILSQKVKAKDLWTNADSIHEFGYYPE